MHPIYMCMTAGFSCSVFSYVKLFSKMATLFCLSTCFLAQCEGVQSLLEHIERQPGGLLPHLEALERDVSQLKDWASGLTEKRGLLQDSVAALTEAVGQIEGRTSVITKDVNTKVWQRPLLYCAFFKKK